MKRFALILILVVQIPWGIFVIEQIRTHVRQSEVTIGGKYVFNPSNPYADRFGVTVVGISNGYVQYAYDSMPATNSISLDIFAASFIAK